MTKAMVNDLSPPFFYQQKQDIMGKFYGQPAPYSGDTTAAKIICKGVMAAISLMGIATVIGLPVIIVLNWVAA